MNLGVNGVSFKDLVTLFRYADTVVINGEVSKNNFGRIQDLDEKGVAGRKEYLEEVVEVKEGKVRVYSEGILKKLVKDSEEEVGDYKMMIKEGVLELVTENKGRLGDSNDVPRN